MPGAGEGLSALVVRQDGDAVHQRAVAEDYRMSWSDELKKIRVLLRDPTGQIWSEGLLRGLFNDVQQDLQRQTDVLEEISVQRVPPTYQCSYQYDWEWSFLQRESSLFYQCLTQHDRKTICHRWESQSYV